MAERHRPTSQGQTRSVDCLPAGAGVVLLPPADPDPAETARREVELAPTWEPGVLGVAGWSRHGWEALELAAGYPEVDDDDRAGGKAARWSRVLSHLAPGTLRR